MEVDCAAYRPFASIDAYIDPIRAGNGYLHTSPEYAMKRLLSLGIGDIYQLSHVFRAGEVGDFHRPEFTMVEWYRLGFSFQQMINETCDYIELFVGKQLREQLTYREAFLTFAGEEPGENWEHVLTEQVEPHFTGEKLWIITHFPKDQAALAKVEGHNALRFEVYFQGLELANGYDELTDVQEHKSRFAASNQKRKTPLEIDPEFIEALERGLPECCGVAVGFDRLMMLKLGANTITDVLP